MQETWMKPDLEKVESDFCGRFGDSQIAAGDGQTGTGTDGRSAHGSDDGNFQGSEINWFVFVNQKKLIFL